MTRGTTHGTTQEGWGAAQCSKIEAEIRSGKSLLKKKYFEDGEIVSMITPLINETFDELKGYEEELVAKTASRVKQARQ